MRQLWRMDGLLMVPSRYGECFVEAWWLEEN